MKKLLSIVTLGAIALALPSSGLAAEKKSKASAEAAPASAESEKKSASAESNPGAPKAMGMYVKVGTIDTKAKKFTHSNADQTIVTFVVTDKTEIRNGDAPAKFEDIKVGDTVSGSRIKKSPVEYEVVKITKFGVAPAREKKAEGEKKEGSKKAEGAKKPGEKKE